MAVYTVSNAGGNYNVGATWVGGIVPSTTDTVDFTATSGNLTIPVSTTCAGIDFTNYVGTLTVNTTFRINGNINFGTGGYTVGGSNTTYIGATGTITSNGVVWTGNFGFLGTSQTYTLADDLTVNGTITCNVTTLGTLNGFTLYVNSNWSHTGANFGGTTNLVFNGTGFWSHTSSGSLGLNTTINTSGTITCGANVRYNTGILTYTAGTVVVTNSTLIIVGACTLDTSGITWNNVTFSAGTRTLLSDLNIAGNLTTQSSAVVLNGLFNINVRGNLTINIQTSGTASIILNGTGTWSGTNTLSTNLTIDTSGTITISGIVYYGTRTLTYVSGIVIVTGSTLNIQAGCTLNTNGINWNNLACLSGVNFTSDFTVNGTFTTANGNTYNGSNLILNGNLTAHQLTLGTTVFRYRGTGYWSGGGWIGNLMYIETDGTLLILGGTFGSASQVANLIYVKGKITKNSTLQINATANLYGFGNGKVLITSVTLLANAYLRIDDMFWGTPDLKTRVNGVATSRLVFSTPRQRKAFFVSLNGIVLGVAGSLNVINRDGNRGGNIGVIFGERGMNGFPLNQFPTEPNYSFGDGLYNNMNI